MTTSDDEPVIQDSGDPASDDLEATTHAESMEEALLDESLVAPPEPGGGKRWLLAALACVLIILAGSAIWAGVYQWQDQEYVGVSVLIGIASGWALRTITKRSDMVVRFVAVVVTLVGIVVGTIVGAAWYTSTYKLPPFAPDPGSFFEVLPDVAPKFWDIRTDPDSGKVQYAIFAASLVLAYLSAGPQSSGKKKGEPEPVPLDEIVHDPLADPLDMADTEETAAED